MVDYVFLLELSYLTFRDILGKTNTFDLVSFGSAPRIIQSINNPKYPNTYVIGARRFSPSFQNIKDYYCYQ